MAVDEVAIARVAPIFRRALQRVASALPASVPSVSPTTETLPGAGNGAAASGRSGKCAPTPRSTSETSDGPAGKGEAVEESRRLTTAARR